MLTPFRLKLELVEMARKYGITVDEAIVALATLSNRALKAAKAGEELRKAFARIGESNAT